MLGLNVLAFSMLTRWLNSCVTTSESHPWLLLTLKSQLVSQRLMEFSLGMALPLLYSALLRVALTRRGKSWW